MQSVARISLLREAMAAGDMQASLDVLALIRAEGYPTVLLRPLLASCHPRLDPCYIDLQLVPAPLLLAPSCPAALASAPLDPLQLQLAHGCDPATFVAVHLNAVLRGERALYAGLPAIEIRHYRQLVKLSPRRHWLQQCTALECLSRESLSLESAQGRGSPDSPLSRWQASRHDGLLERPWFWIQGPGQEQGTLLGLALAVDGVMAVKDGPQAAALIQDAARHVLGGGAHYLLWNRSEPPPASWSPLIRGLVERRGQPLSQLGGPRQEPGEMRPVRFSNDPALLAISASWLARREPRQVLGLMKHWLAGPPPLDRPRMALELQRRSDPPLWPTTHQGLLVLAAPAAEVERLGRQQLQRRALQQALEGGFAQGVVLDLGAGAGLDVAGQLAQLAATAGPDARVAAFTGPGDQLAASAWEKLSAQLSWDPHQLLCSDEELIWCQDPMRIGQRQFAAPVTPWRLLSRGHLPGLVALPAAALAGLELQPRYHSLHALLKDLALQWLERGNAIRTLPQALLRREPHSNPTVMAIRTPSQHHPFSGDQLLELERITRRRSLPWLSPEGRLIPGPCRGSFQLRRAPSPTDRVSVIIPFRDQAALTRACVESLVEQAGATPLELVLVDNGSTEAEAVALAESLAPLADSRGFALIGIRDDSPFNFAAINNRARRHCTGNFLLFLNNDIRFESAGPIEALLDPFAFAGTGAVGARLLYEDGSIQHHGLAAAARQPHDILSPGKGLQPGVETDPFTVLQLQEQWTAATAACLLMRSEEFDRLDGFDERFSVAYNDVDLCWRLTAQGRAVIVTPEPRIIHAESRSRGDDIAGEKRNRLARESGALRRRYPSRFQLGDPLYHRFLGPASHRFEPMPLPERPLASSREQLLYSWVRPDIQTRGRHFLIFVHWDVAGEVRPDVIEQLRAYRRHAVVAFVSAAPTLLEQPGAMARLRELCAVVLVRRNEGYDFGSWKAGISFCRSHLERISRLILTNDSCYGPLHSFDSLFKRLEASNADVVGLTESTAISSHLQSYFLAYGSRVLRSALFWEFWDQIGIWGSKVELVRDCEVGWSTTLVDAGFKLEALYLAGEHGNVTHTHWRQLLTELEFPFLKAELLRLNPIRQNIDSWDSVAAAINPRVAQMIRDHLAQQQHAR
ncbi:MAG: glycosyltransferase [Cyanobium sp. PLM2.Bin73]|nr:MAG: glycosyltransferase [Cyanobium sp. PLM2.Bin73]